MLGLEGKGDYALKGGNLGSVDLKTVGEMGHTCDISEQSASRSCYEQSSRRCHHWEVMKHRGA